MKNFYYTPIVHVLVCLKIYWNILVSDFNKVIFVIRKFLLVEIKTFWKRSLKSSIQSD